MPVQDGETDEWGYIDKAGKWKIYPQFAGANSFYGNRALVKIQTSEGDVYGYINREGKLVIPPVYSQALDFNGGVAVAVLSNSVPKIINSEGKTIAELQYAYKVRGFREGMAAVQVVNSDYKLLWGFINTNGQMVIPAVYEEVGYFSEGMCPVKNEEGKWGYIDKSGNVVIPFQFAWAGPFIDRRAIVVDEKTEKWGVIDAQGKVVIDFTFKGLIPASLNSSDYFIAGISMDKIGVIDGSTGSYVINPVFYTILPVINDEYIFPAQDPDNNKWGFIDLKGRWKINPQYDKALPFMQGLAAVEMANRYGFIDTSGALVINPIFEKVGDYVGYTGSFFAMMNILLPEVETEKPDQIVLSTIDYVNPLGLNNKTFTFQDLKNYFEEDFVNQIDIYNPSLVYKIKYLKLDNYEITVYVIGFPYDLVEYQEEVWGFWGPEKVIKRKVIEDLYRKVYGVMYKISASSKEINHFYSQLLEELSEITQTNKPSDNQQYFSNSKTGHFYIVIRRSNTVYLSVFYPSASACQLYDNAMGIIDPYDLDRPSFRLFKALDKYCRNDV